MLTPCCTQPRDSERAAASARQRIARNNARPFPRSCAVGEPRGIAQINEVSAGMAHRRRAQHGQPADTRVEHADRDIRHPSIQNSGRM